jgi:hypothetical protein
MIDRRGGQQLSIPVLPVEDEKILPASHRTQLWEVRTNVSTANATELKRNITDSQRPGPSNLLKIKDLIHRFRVCWEVYPEEVLVKREIRKIGFSVELFGTDAGGAADESPGCGRVRRVQSALEEIANWIVPRERSACRYEVEADSQSLSYSRERGGRPDSRVSIRILHGKERDRPIDESEVRRLQDMEKALTEVGACKGTWRSPTS